jgi:hypothetical protein
LYLAKYHLNLKENVLDHEYVEPEDSMHKMTFLDKKQYLNLIYIDSKFPAIFAELCWYVYQKKLNSFNEYVELKESTFKKNKKFDAKFLKQKFYDFIYFLLYAVEPLELSNRIQFNKDKIYCLKNNSGVLEYYSVYENKQLIEKLYHELSLEIMINTDMSASERIHLSIVYKSPISNNRNSEL